MDKKEPEFICTLCTNSDRKIKISDHTIFEGSNWYSGQLLNIAKSWYLPIHYFLDVTSLTPNLVKKGPMVPVLNNDATARIDVSKFRNAYCQKKFFWTKVIIVPHFKFLMPLVHMHIWPNFEMMMSQHGGGCLLARTYLMMLCVISPIHMNFPVRSRCTLKPIIHRKNSELFYITWESFFFQKDAFDNDVPVNVGCCSLLSCKP